MVFSLTKIENPRVGWGGDNWKEVRERERERERGKEVIEHDGKKRTSECVCCKQPIGYRSRYVLLSDIENVVADRSNRKRSCNVNIHIPGFDHGD